MFINIENNILYKKAVIKTKFLENYCINILKFYKKEFEKIRNNELNNPNLNYNLEFLLNYDKNFLKYFLSKKIDNEQVNKLTSILLMLIKKLEIEVNEEFINDYINDRNFKNNQIIKNQEKIESWDIFNKFYRNSNKLEKIYDEYCEVKLLKPKELFNFIIKNGQTSFTGKKSIIYIDNENLMIKKFKNGYFIDIIANDSFNNKYSMFKSSIKYFDKKKFNNQYFSSKYRPNIDYRYGRLALENENIDNENIDVEYEKLAFLIGMKVNRSIEQDIYKEYCIIDNNFINGRIKEFISGINKSLPSIVNFDESILNNKIIGFDKKNSFLNKRNYFIDKIIIKDWDSYLKKNNNLNFNTAILINTIIDFLSEEIEKNNEILYENKIDLSVILNKIQNEFKNNKIIILYDSLDEEKNEYKLLEFKYNIGILEEKILLSDFEYNVIEINDLNYEDKIYYDEGIISNYNYNKFIKNLYEKFNVELYGTIKNFTSKNNLKNSKEKIENTIYLEKKELYFIYNDVKKYISYKFFRNKFLYFDIIKAISYSYYEELSNIIGKEEFEFILKFDKIKKKIKYIKKNNYINIELLEYNAFDKNMFILTFKVNDKVENSIIIKYKNFEKIFELNKSDFNNFIEINNLNNFKLITLENENKNQEIIFNFKSKDILMSQIIYGLNLSNKTYFKE